MRLSPWTLLMLATAGWLVIRAIPALGQLRPNGPARPSPFLNLDFEEETPQGMPLNWYIEASSSGVRVAVDTTHVHSGQRSLRVTPEGDAPVPLHTPLFLGGGCAHEVQWTGFAYAERLGISIRAVLFRPGGIRSFGEPLALAGGKWQIFQHRMASKTGECLPADLKIGVLIQGAGPAWIDSLQLSVDGAPWGEGQPLSVTPNADHVRALQNAAVRLADFNPDASPSAHARAASVFRSARVIGLGENSHGAAALFRMKLDLIRFLVRERGYTVVALEAPAAETDKVNDYVLGMSSDPDVAVKALTYPSWQTDEMWAMVQWLRDYNRTAKAKVQFRGFDIQHPALAASAAAAVLDSKRYPEASATLTTIQRNVSEGPSGIDKALHEISTLRSAIEKESLPAEVRARLTRYLRILDNGLRTDKPESGGKPRDAYMADEVLALLVESGDSGRVIVWADNTHVTRAHGAMGDYLNQQLGKEYLPVGFTFGRGQYSAYGKELRYPAQVAFPGTHEYLLSRGSQTPYLVNLGLLPDGHPLRQVAGFRYIGSTPQMLNQFYPHRLEDHFDLIGFTESTESTHYRTPPKFD